MRSRASGGSCGDSVAATSALTMSSLRRRAICMQRARSTERSSIGGRASARTTAPASAGSTSSRSQASTSRTSARWKNAAAPTRRYGTARSSSATATAWPSWRTERTSTAMRSGATPSRTSRSTSAATPCACARSFAQRQNATSPPGAASTVQRRGGRRSARRPRARRRAIALRAAERALERARPSRRAGARVKSRRFFVAAPRKRSIAWSSSPATVRSPCGAEQRRAARRARSRLLQLVDEHVAQARATRARTCGRSRSSAIARSTRSPVSSAPRSASMRSWAA